MSEPRQQGRRIGWRGWLTIGGSGLLVFISLCLFWLFYTESGLRWVLSQAQQRTPGTLTVESMEGQLAGPLELGGVRFQDDEGLTVEAGTLRLEWRLGLLVMGVLQLDQVDIDGLHVTLPAGEEEADPGPIELPERISVPLRINVRSLVLNDTRIQPPGEADTIQLDGLTLSGNLARSQITLDQLDARAEWLDLESSLSVDMRDDWPLSLDADWQLRWPDLPEINGTTALSGTPDALAIQQAITGPLILNLEGEVRQALSDPRVRLSLQFRAFEPSRWFEEAPAGLLAGRYRLEGRLDQARLQGRLDASDTPWGDWVIDSDLSGDSELRAVEIHDLRLVHQQQDQWLEMAGRVRDALSPDPEVDLDLTWANLRWPLEGPEYESEAGHARVAGRQSDFMLSLAADFRINQATDPLTRAIDGHIETRLQGNEAQADIESLTLSLGEGQSLAFQGAVRWAEDDPFLGGNFQLQDLDPSLLDEDWPGQLSGDGHLEARWGETVTASLDLDRLEGELVGQTVSAQGGVDYTADVITLRSLRAALGDNRLLASGQLATDPRQASSDLDFSLDMPSLSQLPLAASGRLAAEGELRGSLESLDLRLDLSVEDLSYEDYRLASLTLELDLKEGWEADSELRLELLELTVDGESVPRLLLRGDGSRADHRLSLQAEHPTVSLGLSFAGGLNPEWLTDWQWRGEWVDTRLHNPVAGQWQQRESRPLMASESGASLERLCLDPVEGQGDLCFSAETDSEARWRADIQGEGFPLAMFLDAEGTGINIQGSVDLSAQAEDQGDGVQAQGQLTFTPGLISQRMDGQDMTLLAIDGGQTEFHWTPEAARADMDLALSEGGFLRGRARLPEGMDGPLEGRLDAEIPQLGLLPLLLAEIGRAEGLLTLAVDIGGSLADPDFSGEIQVVDAILNFPDLGITAEAVNAFLSGNTENLSLDASARSGGGDVQFRADLERVGGDWVGDASLDGERFLILDIPDARVRINPALNLTASADQRLDVEGELHVPWARITPGEIQTSVQASSDEVIVGQIRRQAEEDELSDWAIFSRVRVSLGDDVTFDGFGLTGRIAGALTVRDEPNALTRATGELEVREGQYTAWRQQLEIERGRLFFSNTPINDPALDIRAVRRPRNVVVGVNIRGTLRDPQLELFSDPAMQQSEQLSYLLTGRPLTEGGEGDMDLIREAALALQIAGGGYVGRQLGDRLGVDTVTIEAGDTPEETSVVFGEYISPRLFISYGIGLFEGTNVFRMRYEISSRWFLEAQTGPRSGADFIYNLERG